MALNRRRGLIHDRPIAIVLAVVLAVVALPWIVTLRVIPAQQPVSDPNTVLAVVSPGSDLAAVDASAEGLGLTRVGAIPEIGVLQYRPGSRTLASAAAELGALSGVRSAKPVLLTTLSSPTDPLASLQWGLSAIHATDAWSTTRGAGITVAVVDTGVDATHPDLAGQVLAGGYDFVNGDSDPSDDNGHGTHVAGIIAAIADNGIDGAGAAPAVKILPVKVMNAQGSGYSTDIAAGITYAVDHGARVINLSLGGSSPMPDIQAALNYATSHNVVVAAAAGNSGNSVPVGYPAAYPNVIAVGAVNSSLTLASFSDTGSTLDLVAPGVSILSTVPPNTMGSWSGTSMATPFVAAAAAMILSVDPSETPAAVQARLQSTATDLGTPGWDAYYGYGIPNVARAIASIAVSPTPTPTPTASPTPSPTPSPSPTPTLAPSASPSASLSPSSSPSPSPSPSSSPSPSPTPTPTPTPTPPALVSRTTVVTMRYGGTLAAGLSAYPRTSPVTLSLKAYPSGTTLVSLRGTGVVSFSRSVPYGQYAITFAAPSGTIATLTYRLGSGPIVTTTVILKR